MRELSPLETRCQQNILRWFAETGGPEPAFLDDDQKSELGIEKPVIAPDRALIEGTPAVIEHLKKQSRGTWTFGTSLPSHCICKAHTACDGGREFGRVRYALQWILHVIQLSRDTSWRVMEIDFDGFNPGEGLIGSIPHLFGEVIPNSLFRMKTNPFTVAKHRGWLEESAKHKSGA